MNTEHLAWLLFLKFLDEEQQGRLATARLGEGEHCEPVLRGDLVWSERISAPHLGHGSDRSKRVASNMPISGRRSRATVGQDGAEGGETQEVDRRV